MLVQIQSKRVASNLTVSGGNPPKISAAAGEAKILIGWNLYRYKLLLLSSDDQFCKCRLNGKLIDANEKEICYATKKKV